MLNCDRRRCRHRRALLGGARPTKPTSRYEGQERRLLVFLIGSGLRYLRQRGDGTHHARQPTPATSLRRSHLSPFTGRLGAHAPSRGQWTGCLLANDQERTMTQQRSGVAVYSENGTQCPAVLALRASMLTHEQGSLSPSARRDGPVLLALEGWQRFDDTCDGSSMSSGTT